MSRPCADGCKLGLANCVNLPQPWRDYQVHHVCELIHEKGVEFHRRQTIERTEQGWTPWTDAGEVPPQPRVLSTAERRALKPRIRLGVNQHRK